MSESQTPPPAESKPPGTPPPPSGYPSGGPPRPSTSLGLDPLLGGGIDRVARIQTIAAIVLGLALIAIPLYLWRRPRSESVPVTSSLDASSASVGDAGVAAVAPPQPAAAQIILSEAKVMECHDTGSRHTRPEDCDHLAAVEKGFAAAITAGGPCLPSSNGGGTLVYVLDASFGRKRHPFELFVPKDGRALKNPHGAAVAVSACSAAVRKGIDELTLEGVPHAHSRYKIAITATYPPPNGASP